MAGDSLHWLPQIPVNVEDLSEVPEVVRLVAQRLWLISAIQTRDLGQQP